MPANTSYSPTRTSDFDSKSVNFNGSGVFATVPTNASTNVDLKMLDDNIINGLTFIVENATFGDYVTLQVVDVDGILAPAGTVLRQFATKWYVDPSITTQSTPVLPYPAKIYSGLYLRMIYTSTGLIGDVKVAANYHLHKCII